MEYITDMLSRFVSTVSSIDIKDVIDMILLTYCVYKGIKLVRETKAQQLLVGILIVVVVYIVVSELELKAMSYLLQNFFQVGLIALVVVFQPELRRILERVGRTNIRSLNIFNDGYRADNATQNWSDAIDVIGEAASQLSESTTGALIVIERKIRLGEQIDTGTVMDCIPSVATLGSIFFPKTPLHDGAVIIRNARIIAAGCFLPTPQKEETINKQLGSRHRAAIGMSENSDAIIVVVSEETGTISIAENGELTRGYTHERLVKYLKSQIIPEKSQNEGNLFTKLIGRKDKKDARKKQKN
ncbi:MAG TPA: TIGR00159 family protein [Candidatus Faeciplasma gallinarum]|uniref:Diadenylate cyclase n=1 Tax=Candidatus Faeciplasma gallinarum TaxID=2840799 RepID=A0A9D1JHD6_9FIRM|nr:TIGR00159 family protein [Candidatus Faeciplasma gallinarum]